MIARMESLDARQLLAASTTAVAHARSAIVVSRTSTPSAPPPVVASTSATSPTRTRATSTTASQELTATPVTSSSAPLDPGLTLNPVGSGTPVIAITALQGFTIVEGQSFHVEATGTIVPGADIEDASFAWDFGDAAGRFNQMPGFNAAHVYDRPGRYAVTLKVTGPDGSVSTATVSVDVQAASVRTLYVAANGNDAADGSGPGTALRTLGRAVQLAGDDTTILLRRGDTFWQSSTVELSRNNLTIATWGVGNAPTLMWTGARDRSNMLWVKNEARHVTLRGLAFDSVYNADTEQTGMPIAILAGGRNLTVRDNTFRNVGYCINANQKPTGLLVQDNRAPDPLAVRDYFVWAQGSDLVIVGNEVANSTREHVVRVGGADRLVMAHNTLSNLDRTTQGDIKDTGKGAIACQKGSYGYIADNQLRGPAGVGPLGLANGLTDKAARFLHARVQDNVQHEGSFYLQHGAEHVTLIGNTIYRDDQVAFDVIGWNAEYGRGNRDLRFERNVVVNNGTMGNFLLVEARTEGISLTDNVYVAPYLRPGNFGTAAVFVNGSDLSSFTKIDGNVWPSTTRGTAYANGGINFVGTSYTDWGHKAPTTWNNMWPVGDDQFRDVSLDEARRIAA